MRWIFLLFPILLALPSHAILTQSQQNQISNFPTQGTFSTSGNKNMIPPIIPPAGDQQKEDPTACVNEACQTMSCDLKSDADEIAKACKGANGAAGSCIHDTCAQSSCSLRSDLMRVIQTCKEKTKEKKQGSASNSGECIGQICERIGCTFQSDTHEIARLCEHANGGCVRSVCDKTGCTFKSDALAAIKSCSVVE